MEPEGLQESTTILYQKADKSSQFPHTLILSDP